MTTIANVDLSRCIQAPTGATGNLADADVSATLFGEPQAKRRKVVVAPPAALVAAPTRNVATAPAPAEERGSGTAPRPQGHIVVAPADARAHMAATIRANQTRRAGAKFFTDCRFEGTDAHGRSLVWEMRRWTTRTGRADGWRFCVPTVVGYRSDTPFVGLNENEYAQYLLASDDDLGPTTNVKALDALRAVHPERVAAIRPPPLPVYLPPTVAALANQAYAAPPELPPLPPLTADGAADGAADDAADGQLSWDALLAPPSTPIVDDTLRGDALLDLYESVQGDDDDMLGGGTVGGVRVGDLAAELEAHPITTDDLDEMAGFVEIADGLDPYWPMRELEVAPGLVELPELEAAFDAMEVEADTAAATDAAAMADGFFA